MAANIASARGSIVTASQHSRPHTETSRSNSSDEIQVNEVKTAIRNVARPFVRYVRALLEPAPEKVVVDWHVIEAGPAKGCQILLPFPSGFADKIIPGQYETACTAVMEALVRRDSVCLDIGGHYGYFTLVLASLASAGRVDTFEPLPSHAARIAESASRSALGHVTVHQKGVADVSTTMTLRFVAGGNYDSMGYLESCGGVVSESAKEQYPSFDSVSVETVTLDDLSDIEPDFIKIDAEGAEAAILRGGMNLLSRRRPRLLLEVHGIKEAFQCAEVLRRVGYRVILVGEPETTMPVLCVSQDDEAVMGILERAMGSSPVVIFDPSS